MKDEECEGTSDAFLQKYVQKKNCNILNLLIPTASIFKSREVLQTVVYS